MGTKPVPEFGLPETAKHATPVELVDAINGVFGKQEPDARAVHAKGVNLRGTFAPSPAAASISKAVHLQQTSVPVTVRFSNFPGVRALPDTHDLASPRGMAIRFHLPDGSESDIVSHSFNGFPSPNADDFKNLMIAIGTSGPGVAKPTPLDAYLGTHPIAKTFLETQIPPPVSYATVSYFGVNTFKFTNAGGKITYGRYQIRPAAGDHSLPKEEVAKADGDYLSKEIKARLAQGPVKFTLHLEVADAVDKLEDPSIAWPASRNKVELGTFEITEPVADNAVAEHRLLFFPNAVPPGIEPADPMINVRSAAYPVSYDRRSGKV